MVTEYIEETIKPLFLRKLIIYLLNIALEKTKRKYMNIKKDKKLIQIMLLEEYTKLLQLLQKDSLNAK